MTQSVDEQIAAAERERAELRLRLREKPDDTKAQKQLGNVIERIERLSAERETAARVEQRKLEPPAVYSAPSPPTAEEIAAAREHLARLGYLDRSEDQLARIILRLRGVPESVAAYQVHTLGQQIASFIEQERATAARNF